jgi:alpha-tubulin suppressor-like RCC1 family protein
MIPCPKIRYKPASFFTGLGFSFSLCDEKFASQVQKQRLRKNGPTSLCFNVGSPKILLFNVTVIDEETVMVTVETNETCISNMTFYYWSGDQVEPAPITPTSVAIKSGDLVPIEGVGCREFSSYIEVANSVSVAVSSVVKFKLGGIRVNQWFLGSYNQYVHLDQQLQVVGTNFYGNLGNGTPSAVIGSSKLVNVDQSLWGGARVKFGGANAQTIVYLDDNTLWGWGKNTLGELGIGSFSDQLSPVQIPSSSYGGGTVRLIACGYQSSMIVLEDGAVWAWGYNSRGQLGNGTTTASWIPVLSSQVTFGTNIVKTYGGSARFSVLLNDNTVWGWGWNDVGQLGDGTLVDSSTPKQVIEPWAPGRSIKDFTSAGNHCVVILNDGDVWAWGYNAFGQLGDGTTTDRNSPVRVQTSAWGGVAALQASCGFRHTTVLLENGEVWSFGSNTQGQLGIGVTGTSPVTTPVKTLSNVWAPARPVQLQNGAYYYTAVLMDDGRVWGWGSNPYGQLGIGQATGEEPTPVECFCYSNLTHGRLLRLRKPSIELSFDDWPLEEK